MKKNELWVARDIDGDLYLYDSRPYLDKETGIFYGFGCFWELPRDKLPLLTFENSPKKLFVTYY